MAINSTQIRHHTTPPQTNPDSATQLQIFGLFVTTSGWRGDHSTHLSVQEQRPFFSLEKTIEKLYPDLIDYHRYTFIREKIDSNKKVDDEHTVE